MGSYTSNHSAHSSRSTTYGANGSIASSVSEHVAASHVPRVHHEALIEASAGSEHCKSTHTGERLGNAVRDDDFPRLANLNKKSKTRREHVSTRHASVEGKGYTQRLDIIVLGIGEIQQVPRAGVTKGIAPQAPRRDRRRKEWLRKHGRVDPENGWDCNNKASQRGARYKVDQDTAPSPLPYN